MYLYGHSTKFRRASISLLHRTFTFFRIFSSGQSHHLSFRRNVMVSSSKRERMHLAGFPPTIWYGATSLVTRDPAAITAPSPIVIPDRIVLPKPIQTSLPIFTSPSECG